MNYCKQAHDEHHDWIDIRRALKTLAKLAACRSSNSELVRSSGILQKEGSTMPQRYQRGSLRCTKRKAGPDRWE
jgi:hypothetical protein